MLLILHVLCVLCPIRQKMPAQAWHGEDRQHIPFGLLEIMYVVVVALLFVFATRGHPLHLAHGLEDRLVLAQYATQLAFAHACLCMITM